MLLAVVLALVPAVLAANNDTTLPANDTVPVLEPAPESGGGGGGGDPQTPPAGGHLLGDNLAAVLAAAAFKFLSDNFLNVTRIREFLLEVGRAVVRSLLAGGIHMTAKMPMIGVLLGPTAVGVALVLDSFVDLLDPE